MFVEPFVIVMAFVPLIGYLLVLGWIRISGRAVVTTGARDTAALALAISGFFVVGPAELFFPNAAATAFGPIVWLPLLVFYGLIVLLICLTVPAKLVVYGRGPMELFQSLSNVSKLIDPEAIGDETNVQVTLPTYGIHLRLDGYRGIDHAQVVAFEPNVSPAFWNDLLGKLRDEVSGLPAPNPRRGFLMMTVAAALILLLLWIGIKNQERVVDGFRDWLWR